MSFDIRNVKSIDDLIRYFSENLGWDVDVDDFDDIDDISYDFTAEEIGLKEEAFAKISSLKQLQPLVDNQQWGIFCVEFDSNKFEVSALRKILSGLIPKRRNSADHAVWAQQDLLFICNWGEGNNRTIGIAHFEEKDKGLPQIKMISCAPALEDMTQINTFEERLSALSWPSNTSNIEEWRKVWSAAFVSGYRQTIKDSSALTVQLAAEAQHIRNRILNTLEVESSNGYVHLLYEKFKSTLLHDMKPDDFADMYAQTVVYGLFSARCMDESQEDFSAEEAIRCIPNTNPFLKSLMQECLSSQNNSKLSFDELEIGNVVDLLLHTKTDEIIKDFNRQTGGGKEDPVIHFYEEFLTAYDSEKRVQRGVYYTPQPVVNFIVRAVDDIIKTDFGYEDGLATTETKSIKVQRRSKRKVNGMHTTVEADEIVPAIQLLDPATGTGTFLRQTILQIYETFKKNNIKLSRTELSKAWTSYVDSSLLPRINGFELMMAPYAVAHMKLAMVLKDTGYIFDSGSRLKVYLTNSLEEPGNSNAQLSFFDNDPLATEAIFANQAKKNKGINVIIGNPPYSGESANKNDWILGLMEKYKMEPGGKIKLQEKNPKWINDDYVKFIRYAQHLIDLSGNGILAYICPHGFLDSPTFRGMRWSLIDSFSKLYIIDLHGNAKKGEKTPEGTKDDNVFDIQQGVCIILAIKTTNSKSPCKVYHTDVWGIRDLKYDFLQNNSLNTLLFEECHYIKPQYFLLPKDFSNGDEYNGRDFFSVDELFKLNSVGFVSARDKLCIHESKEKLLNVITDFSTKDPETARSDYNLGKDVRDWQVAWAQKDINDNRNDNGDINANLIQKVSYRPFDSKYTYYTGKSKGFQCYPRYEVMKNLISSNNIALCLNKIVKNGDTYQHCFVSRLPIDSCFVSNKTSEITYAFPLFINNGDYQVANLDSSIICEFEKRLNLSYCVNSGELRAETVFNYIYAVLHSNVYRSKFVEFLKIGFPRIKYPKDREQFALLSELGEELIRIHTNTAKNEENYNNSINVGQPVKKIQYEDGHVYINPDYHFDIDVNIWNFKIGCYQVLEKWLKDRKSSYLSENDIYEYKNIIKSISNTIDIMKKIDSIIDF